MKTRYVRKALPEMLAVKLTKEDYQLKIVNLTLEAGREIGAKGGEPASIRFFVAEDTRERVLLFDYKQPFWLVRLWRKLTAW